MQLTTYRRANAEFFAPEARPSRAQWCEWIEREVVRGKIIDGTPYVDINWFAASGNTLQPATESEGLTAMDLLAG